MQRAREQLLAGAGLAKNQKSGRCRSDLLDGATNLLHSRIARDDSRHHGCLLHRLKAPVLLLQIVNTECPLEHQRQDHGFEWFLAKIVGTQGDCLERVGAVVLPGKDDHLGVGCQCVNLLEELQALSRVVRTRRKTEVHRDDGRLVATHRGNCRLAIARDDRFVLIECPAHLFLQRRIVFDDEQVPARLAHAASLGSRVEAAVSCPSGNTTRTRVPTLAVLSTRIRPPRSVTYCELS